ncbi:hypothetical protein BDW62DRAFT_194221 [Aspergillus aurantiobrunneus]
MSAHFETCFNTQYHNLYTIFYLTISHIPHPTVFNRSQNLCNVRPSLRSLLPVYGTTRSRNRASMRQVPKLRRRASRAVFAGKYVRCLPSSCSTPPLIKMNDTSRLTNC